MMPFFRNTLFILGWFIGLTMVQAQDQINARRLLKLARDAYDESAYEQAKDRYTQAIAANPVASVAYAERADTEIQLGQYADAVIDCQQAIRLDSGNYFAYFIQGDAYLRLEKQAEALLALTKSISLRPDLGSAYWLRAKAYQISRQYDLALADYGKAIDLLPARKKDLQRERDELARLALILKPLKTNESYTLTSGQAAPSIVWINPNALKFPNGYLLSADRLVIELTIRASTTEEQLLRYISVLVDGQPYSDKMGEKKLKKSSKQQLFSFDYTLELTPGRHSILVVLRLPEQPVETSDPLDVIVPQAGKPDLYLLAFGVKSDLLFTKQDAEGIQKAFLGQQGKLYDQVYAQSITGDETTAFDIAAKIEELAQKPIKDKDLIILFFSGHGTLDNSDLRLLGHRYRTEAPKTTSLSYRDAFVGPLSRLKGKKLILLDACHSGQAISTERGERSAPLTIVDAQQILAETPPGLVIITSSSQNQKSYEDPIWQNGAFTNTLLEALNDGKADADHNGAINVRELYVYLQREVNKKVVNVKKMSQTPAIQIDGPDFPIFWTALKPKH